MKLVNDEMKRLVEENKRLRQENQQLTKQIIMKLMSDKQKG